MTNFIIAHLYPVLLVVAILSGTFGMVVMAALAANGRIDHCDKCMHRESI